MRSLLIFCLIIAALSAKLARAADDPIIPNFWDPQERVIRPDVKDLPRLRFLTTTDFPPFSYVDSDKRLSGFHIDLSRAICRELELLNVCQIQALPFAQLESELNAGNGDAIIAGIAINAETRERLEFSRPYFRLPARFVAKKGSGLAEPLVKSLEGAPVGVVDGTAHAAFARDHFSDIHVRLFANQEDALVALNKGDVKAVFSDGLSLAFWLQGPRGRECCQFVGEPHLSERYFGAGLAVALPRDNEELAEAINAALRAINDKGIFAELYLRYFPISLF